MINKLKLRVLSMLVVIILIIIAGWLLARKKQEEKTLKLPDGSMLSLAKVTYGTNHQVRYGTRWQDFLHPILPAKMQTNFSARIATHTTSSSNGIVVWLRRTQILLPTNYIYSKYNPPDYQISLVDSNGLESELMQSFSCSYGAWPDGILSGWELASYPKRNRELGIKIYFRDEIGNLRSIGKFKIENKFQVKTDDWKPQALPATRETNGLGVTLVKLETGLTEKESGMGPAGVGAKSFSRAIFRMRDGGKQTESWSATGIKASAASGEERPASGYASRWIGGEQQFAFNGPLWIEEPAWKLQVEVSRTKDFPVEELWTIKGVPVPEAGKVVEINATTNIYGAEIVFQGISAAKAKLPQEWTRVEPYVNLHASHPIPMSDMHLRLVEVRDDRGRGVKASSFSSRTSTGGRGATPKELIHGFGIEIPEGAKKLDVTFVFSKSRYVEFFAKPVIVNTGIQKSEVRIEK